MFDFSDAPSFAEAEEKKQSPALALDHLNPEQRSAVENTDGPLLVLAGAGTGKTRVLTTRIAHILNSNLAFPSQILAVTFTNKASREMQERVLSMVNEHLQQGLWLGTFHSIGVRILRRHAEILGYNSSFTILDADDQIRLLKQIITEHNIDEKRWPAKLLAASINSLKDRGLTPAKVTAAELNNDFAHGKLLLLYEAYQHRLKGLSAMDFGDLLLNMLVLFEEHPDILAEYQRRFHYILVDEYQDTNVAQYLWLRLLSKKHNNICCVGDDDQSIYGWRGAEVGNILRFEKDFKDAEVIRLERNYRSTGDILAAASRLISHNEGRLGKTLWTEDGKSERIKIVSLWDDKQEAKYIAEEIDAIQQLRKCPLSEVAILVRAGFQTREFEESFISTGIPYKVIGGLRFYERREIRDMIAYLRLTRLHSDDMAFERIINVPKRGLGKSALEKIRTAARGWDISMMEAVGELLKAGSFKGKAAATLREFLNCYKLWSLLARNESPEVTAEAVMNESGYLAMWKTEKTPEAEGRVENLKELANALKDFENMDGFLEHVSLVSDIDEMDDKNMVRIMTLHAAKGLEFENVFLPGWEEGLFPHQRSLDEKGTLGLEEERRLAYVGMTRAKKKLTITFAGSRRIYNQWQSSIPSRFIDELPEENTEIINAAGTGYRNKPVSLKQDMEKIAKPKVQEKFHNGKRIFHQKFGYGRITEKSGNYLTIEFEKAGIKTVMADYIEEF